MNQYVLDFQNKYLEKQYQKKVSDQSSRLLRRILVGYFAFFVIPEIAEASINQDYNNIDSNEVLSIIGYLMFSICYIGLTKKKELYNYICLVAHIAILLTGMLGMIKHTKQNNTYVKDDSEEKSRSWVMQNIFQYSAIQVGFHFIISLISSSIKIALTAFTIVYATFILYIVILVSEGSRVSNFSVVMIIFFAFIACQMYFIHYNHKIRRQNFLHQFNDKQFTNILKNGLNQNIFFVSYNQTLNNIDIWFSNKSCEKYFSSQNKGEFKKFTRSVYLQEQASSHQEEFYPDENGNGGKNKRGGDRNNQNNGDIVDEYDLAEKKRNLQANTKDKNTKLENIIIELIKAQIKKQKHKNYYDFSSFKKYLAIQKEEVVTATSKNGNSQSNSNNSNQKGQVQQKEKLFQFKINTFIRNSCFNSCIIFNEEEWDKYNVLYQQKCQLQLQKQQDFIQMLQPVIKIIEPFYYLNESIGACVNQGTTLLNNMFLYNLIVQNKYDKKQITLPGYLKRFSLVNLLEFIKSSNQVFFPIEYNITAQSSDIENIFLISNKERVSQIIQNFILEINSVVHAYRTNKIDVIRINAKQMKGKNEQSNIIKFTISFSLSPDNIQPTNTNLSPYPIHRSTYSSQGQLLPSSPSGNQLERSLGYNLSLHPQQVQNDYLLNMNVAGDQTPSILFEENEEDDEEENDDEDDCSNQSDSLNLKQRKGDLDKGNKMESDNFEDEEEDKMNQDYDKNYYENDDEKVRLKQGKYKLCKLQKMYSKSQSKSKEDNQSKVHSKNISLTMTKQNLKNNASENKDEIKNKNSLLHLSMNQINNQQQYQSKEFLSNMNENHDQNTTGKFLSSLNMKSLAKNDIASINSKIGQIPSSVSFQNFTTPYISNDNLKQKQTKVQQGGNDVNTTTNATSDNITFQTKQQQTASSNLNSNIGLIANISGYNEITSPSNLCSMSNTDNLKQQLQGDYKDSQYKLNNIKMDDDLHSDILIKFEDQEQQISEIEQNSNQRIEEYQTSDQIVNGQNSNTNKYKAQNLKNYSFENQTILKNNENGIILLDRDLNTDKLNDNSSTNNQIQQNYKQMNNVYIDKFQKNPHHSLQQQKLNESQIQDSQKGSNLYIGGIAGNLVEDSFSFQSPSNNVINSIKPHENQPQIITNFQINQGQFHQSANQCIRESLSFNAQDLKNENDQYQLSCGKQNQFNKDLIQGNSNIKIDSLSGDNIKRLENKIHFADNDNLILFKDDKDSKNSSICYDETNKYKNENDISRDDQYGMKKRNTSHFAEIPNSYQQTFQQEQNPIFQNNQIILNQQNINKVDDLQINIYNTYIINQSDNKNDKFINQQEIKNEQIIYSNQNKKTLNKSPQESHHINKQQIPQITKMSSVKSQSSSKVKQQKFFKKGGSLENSKLIRLMNNNLPNNSLSQSQQIMSPPLMVSQISQQKEIQSQNMVMLENSINPTGMLNQSMKPQQRKQMSPNSRTAKKVGSVIQSQMQQENIRNSSQSSATIPAGVQQSSILQNHAGAASQNTTLNLKYLYSETLRILKTFKPDKDLDYQRLNCLNLQVNAKLIGALGPKNDIIVDDNQFCFLLYENMSILHSTDQQFLNNSFQNLINNDENFNQENNTEQMSIGKLGYQYKQSSNINLNVSTHQNQLKNDNEIHNNLSESQLSNLITSQQQIEGSAKKIDLSNFSPGKIFRSMNFTDQSKM